MSLDEHSPNGTLVHQVTFTDPDPGQDHTFRIQGGNPGGAFAINAANGRIRVADRDALDFETRPSYELRVRVTDNGIPVKAGVGTITVNLSRSNSRPDRHHPVRCQTVRREPARRHDGGHPHHHRPRRG